MRELAEILRDNLSFYNELAIVDKDKLVQGTIIKAYRKNQLIITNDIDTLNVYLILSGSVRAIVESESGKTVTIHKYDKQSPLFMSFGKKYLDIEVGYNLLVEENCQIACLPSNVANTLFNTLACVKDFVIKHLLITLSNAVGILQQINNRDLLARLAQCLVTRKAMQNSNTIFLTHEQIAQEIGSVREVVTRNLKKLKDLGIVGLERGKITIISFEKLFEMASL